MSETAHEINIWYAGEFLSTVFFRGSQSEILDLRERIANVLNAYGLSPNKGRTAIFLMGLERMEELLKEKLPKEHLARLKMYRKLKELQAEDHIRDIEMELSRYLGLEGFIDFCKNEVGLEEKEIHEKIQRFISNPAQDSNKTAELKAWITETLQSGPMRTRDIRALAAEDGLIKDEKDWSLMRQVAHRLGVVKEHGVWGL